jgi:RIO kinase 1
MTHPLDPLLDDGIIDEVLGRLKSGKEADIFRVLRGGQTIAAKVYKDRATRSFKSNADYKEGRVVRNSRTQRAVESGSKFGRQSEESAWKSAEADALGRLSAAGLRVPLPVMFYEGVLLMQLVTDAHGNAAPRLIELDLNAEIAHAMYLDIRSQIIGMLCLELIHGDLSPYNILGGADGPVIIDFPQIVSAPHNTRAEFFFRRDFENIREFLAIADPRISAFRDDARKIWAAYKARDLTPSFVPSAPISMERTSERVRSLRPAAAGSALPPLDTNQLISQFSTRWDRDTAHTPLPPIVTTKVAASRDPRRAEAPRVDSAPRPQRAWRPAPSSALSGAPRPSAGGRRRPKRRS